MRRLRKLYRPYAQTSVWVLVLDSFLIALSTLLLEYHLHLALGVLDNRSFNLDAAWRDYGVSAECIIPRANFMYILQCQNVTNAHVFEMRDSEQVFGCEKVFTPCERGNDVLRRLRADKGKCGGCVFRESCLG
jgi:hypothetical protein